MMRDRFVLRSSLPVDCHQYRSLHVRLRSVRLISSLNHVFSFLTFGYIRYLKHNKHDVFSTSRLSTVTRATCRARTMVFASWFLSLVCAIPQLSVWSLQSHPQFPWYHQCVTFGAFDTRAAELAYGWFITILMYGLPLITIIVCYAGIWFRISYYSKSSGQPSN